jgi:hypothetical protein
MRDSLAQGRREWLCQTLGLKVFLQKCEIDLFIPTYAVVYSIRREVLIFVLLIIIQRAAADSSVLPSNQYWKVNPPLNYTDVIYAGWEQIPVEKEIEVYNGVDVGRTVRRASQTI